MCDYCADLHPTVRIQTPDMLSQMLLRAADRLADGTLADITLAYAKVRRISPDYVQTFARSGYASTPTSRATATCTTGTIS